MRGFVLASVVAVALLLAPAAVAGGPTMLVGVAEDAVKAANPVEVQARMNLLRLAGFNAIRLTALWEPGKQTLSSLESLQYQNVVDAARLTGFRIFVAVYPFGSSVTPKTPDDQDAVAGFAVSIARQFPQITDFIIGNEPNLNRFWLPQFGPAGENVAAPSYLGVLARSFDRLKALSQGITIYGGAVSPRGGDRPGTGRDTHSPTKFIRDLGAAHRATGRTIPVMDAFAFHPYPENSSTPPTLAHPNSTSLGLADYDKLVALLGEAFDGTGQKGSTLPILYAEFGVETMIPPAKGSLYTGTEPATIRPTDETTQAAYYRQALAMAFCQPNVIGLFIFHGFDEIQLDRLQSGVYYADAEPKTSRDGVRLAIRDVRGGVVTRCNGLGLVPNAQVVYPTAAAIKAGNARLTLTCTLDCVYDVRLVKLATATTTLKVVGQTTAGTATSVALPKRRVAPGRYSVTVRLTAPVNPAAPRLLSPKSVTVR